MEILYKDRIIIEVINHQFKLAGYSVIFMDIPAEGIKVKKKNIHWFKYYKFKNEAQYKEWKEWGKKKLMDVGYSWYKIDEVDMVYGLDYERKEEIKKGQLF